ncbi:HAD family hydrolase [Deinococcus aquiradiocola]|uniref:HAD family hydrolase n=1 Tax=Deinococcus aquiradiocola TaxID=393059 RepID=A0A917P4L5_9DEIO|nr:HAD family hydrolase [Deinococcus aquiradiocola]GGJ61449.1 hypothetical protein GCM10008939_01470 [Deinococcus aquiradiocola]
MRAVLFDLDGTLHDRACTVRRWLVGHVGRFGLPDGYVDRWLALDDLGYRPKREVFPLLVREFSLPHDPEVLLADFDRHAWDDVAPMPHAHDVLARLRANGVRLGIVTNGWTCKQQQCLDGLRLGPLVDDVLISEAAGVRKPDPDIFRLALARLGVDAHEAVYVGDSPGNDVLGPQGVGMRAALLPGGHALPDGVTPDWQLTDLRDVLRIVPGHVDAPGAR